MTLLFVIAIYGMGRQKKRAIRSAQATDSLERVTQSLRSKVKRLEARVRQQRQKIQERTVEITKIRNRQDQIRREIASAYEGKVERVGGKRNGQSGTEKLKYVVYDQMGQRMVNIHYQIQLQRLTFSGNVLFDPNEYALSPEGKNLLRVVGKAIDDEIASIERIQIEGHTDNLPTTQYEHGNLELGALRAISVYKFFEKSQKVSINLDQHPMSATSFGDSRPVASNSTEKGRTQNRRIELLLFFDQGSDTDTLSAPTS